MIRSQTKLQYITWHTTRTVDRDWEIGPMDAYSVNGPSKMATLFWQIHFSSGSPVGALAANPIEPLREQWPSIADLQAQNAPTEQPFPTLRPKSSVRLWPSSGPGMSAVTRALAWFALAHAASRQNRRPLSTRGPYRQGGALGGNELETASACVVIAAPTAAGGMPNSMCTTAN